MNRTAVHSPKTDVDWYSRGQYFYDLIVVLTQKEIKIRYKSTWLGYLWSVANPLAFALLYFVAFRVFMRVEIPNYPLFLVAGLFPWQWLANSINLSPIIFLQNATLLKKMSFPRNILVATTVLNDAVHFVLSIPVVLVFLLFYGFIPSWKWFIGIPVLVLAQFMLVYGLSLGIASLNLFFRDLERLTVLLVTFLFFLTPIVYSASMIPAEYQRLIYLNPVVPLFVSWRELFLSGRLDWRLIVAAYVYAGMAFGLGSLVYRKLSWKFAEVV
jgi:lipopolysaccharide transport system permease protein